MIPDTVHNPYIPMRLNVYSSGRMSILRMCMVLIAVVFAVLACPCVAAEETAGTDEQKAASLEEGTAVEEPVTQGEAEVPSKCYEGSLRLGFDGIWGPEDDDIEMDQFFQFKLDPPDAERLHLRGAFWVLEKLETPSSERSALRDLNDTFEDDVLARVSSLYLDIDDVWGDSVLRLGRQRITEGAAYNRIDGAYFKQKQSNWDWYVFGGTRASFYGEVFEDPVYGAGVSVAPSSRTKLALDMYMGHERQYTSRHFSLHGPVAAIYRRITAEDYEDSVDSFSAIISVWHTVSENLSLFGRLSLYDEGGEEVLLNAAGQIPGWLDLTYDITYRHQFNSIGDRTNDITGFYRTIGIYEEYDNLFISVYRPITEKLLVSLETELNFTSAEDRANRDYQRYAAYLQGEKLFGGAELDARIGVENWVVSKGGGSWAVVGEVGRRWDNIQVALGADYQRYRDHVIESNEALLLLDMARKWFSPGSLQIYNPLLLVFGDYTVEMHENIYTIYLKTKWNISESHEVAGKIAYEDGDAPDTPSWRFQADYTYRF